MRDYALLAIAILLLIVLFPIMFVYQGFRDKYDMKHFALNLATNIDYVGGTLFFNSDGHTISAMVYDKDVYWAVDGINWLFQDDMHCENAWKYEFIEKPKLYSLKG